MAMGIAEPVIGRAFARPVGSTHPTRRSDRTSSCMTRRISSA